MYLRVKIKCDCGCNYEISQYPEFSRYPTCPSCRHPLDNDTLTGLFKIFEATKYMTENAGEKLSFSLKKKNPA